MVATTTYAFYDLVGTSQAFRDGTAEAALTSFWNQADAWATHAPSDPLPLTEERNKVTSPGVIVRTFSDSAILRTREEHTLDAFYGLARSLKTTLERSGKVYCLVCRDTAVSAPRFPATGAVAIDSDFTKAYENIGGSGAAWVNLLYGAAAVEAQKAWHQHYSLYAVGPKSLPTGAQPPAQITIKGFGGASVDVFALE